MGKKSKKSKKKVHEDDGNIHDERFQIAQTHPTFQKRHTSRRRKEFGDDDKEPQGNLLLGSTSSAKDGELIDERFQALLTDSRFSMCGDVGVLEGASDKYGRKQRKKTKKKQEKEIDDEDDNSIDDSDNGGEKEIKQKNSGKGEKNTIDTNDSKDSGETDSDKNDDSKDMLDQNPESRIAYLTALSRGEIDDTSSSDEESEDDDGNKSSDDDSTGSEDSFYGTAGVLDPSTKAEEIDETEIIFDKSRFLAVCNVDWSNVRAVDLYAIVSSFSPPGSVKNVDVYPSNFGLERMEKDKTLGPVGIWKRTKKAPDEKEQDDSENSDEEQNHQDGDDVDDSQSDKSDDTSRSEGVNESGGYESGEDDEEEHNEIDIAQYEKFKENNNDIAVETDFDAEKLRAYEASKLKYFFAVVEFTSSDAADVAYKELNGMEIGHSSVNLDLRCIPESDISDVIKDREVRDKSSVLPSNYDVPDFVVTALQQTNVQCSWEVGDRGRERLLTQYGVGNETWNAMSEGDDLRAYLASDVSSNDEESDDEVDKKRGSNMRKLLGLADSDDDDENIGKSKEDHDDDDSFFEDGSNPASDDSENDEEGVKSFTFVPGKGGLEDKIRSKLKDKKEGNEVKKELTPWEKYQLKRKDKRKEKKRLAKNAKMKFQGKKVNESDSDSDDEIDNAKSSSKKRVSNNNVTRKGASEAELDLLLAGDKDEEATKDFSMRDLIRIDKNKSKKLRGNRKRKEQELEANTSGLDFKIDTTDGRFSAVLDGTDARYGIDRTDPQYKETPAMREILDEQTKRRKRKKRKKNDVVADVNVDKMGTQSSGALALSSLVKSLKSKVAKS